MQKIEPAAVSRPFKLSEISEYFGISKKELYLMLVGLSSKQRVFSHDVEWDGDGDYFLSHFATTILIMKCGGLREEMLLKLDRFLKENQPQIGEYISRLYLAFRKLVLEQECDRIQKEIKQTNDYRAALDHVLEFSSCPSDMAN